MDSFDVNQNLCTPHEYAITGRLTDQALVPNRTQFGSEILLYVMDTLVHSLNATYIFCAFDQAQYV